ncbi:gamma-glutamyl hydrolase [Drosophila busckii]|uniref:gamma-glutamyl hydrolase n=1 Tax=Drosophila busckii TaxID=30019 RepID=UPI00083F4658|nr:gamma-glutamyl hydrolase [Drosophila busckii]
MTANVSKTKTPNVGVLCIDNAKIFEEIYGKINHSYISCAYVKYLEAAGAHVVPIWIGRPRVYYQELLSQLNGVLLPGGAVFLDSAQAPELSNDCVESARYICEIALELNEQQRYFPIWGTCLGFQLLLINAAKTKEVRIDCDVMNKALPLQLVEDYESSQLLKALTPALAAQMQCVPFACHQHRYCITTATLEEFKLAADWRVLATAVDNKQLRFVTLIEHRRYPLFGSQFHPERANYEQLFMRADPWQEAHSQPCLQSAHYFAEFFVDCCRRNGNSFASDKEKARHIIWNWQPVFSGKHSTTQQCYLFPKNVDYPAA